MAKTENNMITRDELIDFSNWFDTTYGGQMITMEETVDEYLKIKSIKLSSDNDKVCQHNWILFNIKDEIAICSKCHKIESIWQNG